MSLKNAILLCWLLTGINGWGKGTGNQLHAQHIAHVQSPDKSIVLQVLLSATGEIQYTVQKSGVKVIQPSALGVMMKGHDFTQGMKLANVSKPERITDRYQTKNAKRRSRSK